MSKIISLKLIILLIIATFLWIWVYFEYKKPININWREGMIEHNIK